MKKTFTYIELLIALAVMAIILIPVMQLFSHTLRSVSSSQGLIAATNLAKWQMERVKNLNFTTTQLRELGTTFYPPLEDDPLEMDNVKWRIETEFIPDSSPLEVWVRVYYDNNLDNPEIALVTLIEDMTWESLVTSKE